MSSEIEQLTEELTCQEVMLSSLEGLNFDGIEQERGEMRAEIARLQRLIDKARRGEPPIDDDYDSSPEVRQQSQTNTSQALESSATEPSSSNHPFRNSSATPRIREPASTPTRATFSDAGSVSLPSRKRERSSTHYNGPEITYKARRTTPVPSSMDDEPFATPTKRNGNMAVDFIDLTDDNNSYTTSANSRQQREAARYKQEAEDRRMALQLSQGASWNHPSNATPSSSSHGPSSQGHPSGSGYNDAFGRIMATQQANSGPINLDPEPVSSPSRDNGMYASRASSIGQDPTLRIPGSFDPAWSHPARPGPPMPGLRIPPGLANNLPSNVPKGQEAMYFNGNMASGDPMRNYHQQRPYGGAQFGAFQEGPYGTNTGFMSARSRPYGPVHPPANPLSDVINRTGQYDYVNGVDAYGQPLPERVTNYLDDLMHDSRVSEQELDDLLKNIRPDMDIPENNRNGTPEGLKNTLYYHQELALAWMKQMEEGSNKGGILADDMGLGKTISVISLMLERKATSRPKTNLVVAPLALVRQWEEEIKSKIKPFHSLSTFIYHNRKATTDDLLQYDVVLTTYGTLAAEMKRLETLYEQNKTRQIDFNDKSIAQKCPLLHPTKANFYRIILDEAQCIKNQKSQTSKAACSLRGIHRWCLTGTPMMNGIVELFALLKFLRIKPYCHWEKFRNAFGTLFGKQGEPRGQAMRRLRATLKAIMLRRKKDSQLDGKPILRLPAKNEEKIHVTMSPDELDFYKQLENKSQVLFNKYLREGSVGKNYSNILVLLLRLRQACCHPHLNLDVEESAETSTADVAELVKGLDPSTVTRIKDVEAFECPICYDGVQNPSFFIPCGHDSCINCVSQLVDNAMAAALREGNENSHCRCPVCRGQFDPKKCFTYEAFREIHMPETVKAEADVTEVADSEDDDDDDDDLSDSETESDDDDDDDLDHRGNLRGFIVDDDDDDGEEDRKSAVLDAGDSKEDVKPTIKKAKKKKRSKKSKGKGKSKLEEVRPSMLKTLRKEAYKNRDTYRRYMAYLRKTWLPSAKVTECLELLRRIDSAPPTPDHPNPEKTIVFSQWTFLLDLIEVAMRNDGGFAHRPRRYDGSMSATQRNDAANAFRNRADVRVILVSLRAGNAGLNLTAASRVIILDPFWNPYIEMQAVDRAYRIGQKREVTVHRILTTETVEDRIIELQEQKKEMVESALDESESRKIGRLSTRELRFLFTGQR